jgi:ethanolamine ammonia-lyase small subunit
LALPDRLPGLARIGAIGNVEVTAVLPDVEPLERQALARPLDAKAIVQAIRCAVRATHEMRTVVAEKLASSAIERHRKMPA